MASENKLVNKIVEILDKKLAEDITVLNVSSLTTHAEYFIIAEGKTERQTQALCDNLEEELAKDKIYAINKEGYRTGDWILLGFDDIVIHIFKPEARQFYNLEHVWQDAIHVDINDLIVK